MHISDGILTESLAGQIGLVSTTAASVGLLAISLKKIKTEDLPKTALLAAVFFVSSLIHFKFGFSSLHLVLIGLMGILLGWRSIAAIFVGLTLQAFFFGHGGITVLGVNLFNFSIGALVAMYCFRLLNGNQKRGLIAGFAAGFFWDYGCGSSFIARSSSGW
jgi:cobalt/nickel transport system permease protein